MSVETTADQPGPRRQRFLSVAEQALELGVSEVTLYRAIKSGEFPAVRIRGRLCIPEGAAQAMAEAALTGVTTVDSSNWVLIERGTEK